jgi:hypothetical protein
MFFMDHVLATCESLVNPPLLWSKKLREPYQQERIVAASYAPEGDARETAKRVSWWSSDSRSLSNNPGTGTKRRLCSLRWPHLL